MSPYKDNFIVKGGILITAMIGITHRSTMDIDTSIRNHNLSIEDLTRIIEEIKEIDLGDSVSFEIKSFSNIMDDMEYPGIRIAMNALIGKIIVPIKIDISTGDVITPKAIEYQYKLLLENRSIGLWSYNLETILSEKLQTILARGILNTRMRDFYDIRMLLLAYEQEINEEILRQAFDETCKKRETENLKIEGSKTLDIIKKDESLLRLWNQYKKKYSYAADIDYEDVMESVKILFYKIING